MYPIALDVAGKRCLVVGGGTIATDKVTGLQAADAAVTVVSPEVSRHLEELAAGGEITLARRPYRRADLDGVFLAIAATDQMAVNARIAAEARAIGVLVNAVDDPPNCDFFAVAVVRRGDLQLGISTGGRSPAFARWLREYLDAWLPAEIGELLAVLAEVRQTLKPRGPLPAYESWQAAITNDVLTQLRQGDRHGARDLLFRSLLSAHQDSRIIRRDLRRGGPEWPPASPSPEWPPAPLTTKAGRPECRPLRRPRRRRTDNSRPPMAQSTGRLEG